MKLNHLKGVFVVGERKTFAQLGEIIELGRKANTLIGEIVGSQEGALVVSNEDIRLLEKQSDRISFKIKEDIVNGAVNPNILDNLLDSVDLADEIIDNYYFVSRELKRMAFARSTQDFDEVPFELNATFKKIVELADQALVILQKLLTTNDMIEVSDLRSDIELLEEEGDNLKDSGFDSLYCAASKMHYLQFNHFSELLHKFDDNLDACEDLSDLIVAVLTSISK
jgi:uncharacterized protein